MCSVKSGPGKRSPHGAASSWDDSNARRHRSPPGHHPPARPAAARRAGRPPRAAPPEHRHRRGDRAARRRRRPGGASGRCALPAAAPRLARSSCQLRVAVLMPHPGYWPRLGLVTRSLTAPLPAQQTASAGDPRGPERGRVVEPRQRGHLLRQGGDLATNRRDKQEMSVLCLRILQAALVYVNTLMIQDLLAEPEWADALTAEDQRGLTPLFWSHVLPYGEVKLNMTSRLPLSTSSS